ncbi:MAG: glycosyltransferase family 4 protein [Haliscomenobacter sp.]|uniref:glycosyltransferase family 4 protein n=1 Tax=Haliscomenobacter sp. TaxID=2717303 RepID=UPI0029AFA691|nr:glycosyltransferase family 4 protein [Haliscomenobacter sp.]MDX2067871.1 glycosyltransferase family 4 protein [Haliscomenobacter sp.]
MKRLAIICTHPIQYLAPVFRLLAQERPIKVFYTWGNQEQSQYDPGFGREIYWDVPLLEGYDYQFVPNTSKQAGSHHFMGIVNPDLIEEILHWSPSAVLVYGWSYYSHLQLMRRLKGQIPVWFRGDSHLLDEQPLWKRVIKRVVLRQVFSWVDLAFYVGTANKWYFQAAGLKEPQLAFAPHAIDNKRFADDINKQYAHKAVQWRAQLGFMPEDKVLLYAGKLEPKKNPILLLKAVQQYNTRHTLQLKLLYVGNGVLETELKQLAKEDPNVHFLDFQNQSRMPIVYRLGDVFCLPSSGPGETWGLAINEALASGIPVIVSDRVGCAIDLIHPEDTGYVFKHNDFNHFQEVLHVLIEEIKQGKLIGKPAKFIANWSFEQQIEPLKRFLN